ncbi:hypothetical protein B0H13DRAFT_1856284 [Mycena leptocephala]|nr:hypothetical protein B0H13DRAFT_1856284 [Mycena leptocephala]
MIVSSPRARIFFFVEFDNNELRYFSLPRRRTAILSPPTSPPACRLVGIMDVAAVGAARARAAGRLERLGDDWVLGGAVVEFVRVTGERESEAERHRLRDWMWV